MSSGNNCIQISNIPKCWCEKTAKTVECRKGNNAGRSFYSCVKPTSDVTNCKFFAWCINEELLRRLVNLENQVVLLSTRKGNE